MNRYTAQGITLDAVQGRRIIFITGTQNLVGEALEALVAAAPDDTIATVYHTNGNQRVEYRGGGRVIFRSRRQLVRGLTAGSVK